MTAPDTAALVAELRGGIAECGYRDADDPCPACVSDARCADALEAQAARITELEAHNRRLAGTMTGDTATDHTLWLGESLGALEPESMDRTGHLVTDEWTISCSIEMHGYQEALEAEAAVEDALSRLDAVLRAAKRLRQIPGLSDGDVSPKVRNVTVANVDGPFHSNPNLAGGDLVMGFASFDLRCTADFFLMCCRP